MTIKSNLKYVPRNLIHETAVVGKDVVLGDNVYVRAYAVLEGNIYIGDNTEIGEHAVIKNNVKIGKNNKIFPYVSIGLPGEMGTKGDVVPDDGLIVIGDNNVIREFTTVNFPSLSEKTEIGSNCYIMTKSHIPHDARVGNYVVMATNSIIGGHCIVEDYAYLGLGSITHQFLIIGESAMVGMGAINTKNVLPFSTVVGNPSKYLKFNSVGAERRGFAKDEIISGKNYLDNVVGGISLNSPASYIEKKISYFICSNPTSDYVL